jgi:hypothetical protein
MGSAFDSLPLEDPLHPTTAAERAQRAADQARQQRERVEAIPSNRAAKLAEQAMQDLTQLEDLDSWQAESPLARLTARALVANVYATLAVGQAIQNQTRVLTAIDANLHRFSS